MVTKYAWGVRVSLNFLSLVHRISASNASTSAIYKVYIKNLVNQESRHVLAGTESSLRLLILY